MIFGDVGEGSFMAELRKSSEEVLVDGAAEVIYFVCSQRMSIVWYSALRPFFIGTVNE